jgi:UDP-N-acetylglucosamine acyltransferase
MAKIDPTAKVDATAIIGEDCEIGPYVIIEKNVTLGKNNRILSHVVIKEYTSLGDNNEIGESTVLGGLPQDLGFKGGPTYLKIGNNNIIREFCTIHRGTDPESSTIIGDNNFIMGYLHIAHNCLIGNNVIMANYTALSGHVTVEDYAFLSGGVLIHQHSRIGMSAMVGGGTKMQQDTLPFFLVDGNPAGCFGINIIGLRRRGFTWNQVQNLKQANRLLFYSGLKLQEALIALKEINDPNVDHLINFIQTSKRGFHHPLKGRKGKFKEKEEGEDT